MQKGEAGSRKGSWAQLVPLTGSGFSSFFLLSLVLLPPLFLSFFPLLSFSSFSFFLNTVRCFVPEAPAHGALAPVSVSRFTLGPFTTNQKSRPSLRVRRAEGAFPTDTMALYFGIYSLVLGRGCGQPLDGDLSITRDPPIQSCRVAFLEHDRDFIYCCSLLSQNYFLRYMKKKTIPIIIDTN